MSWVDHARSELDRLAAKPGWPYRPGGEASVEPTALAALGLMGASGAVEPPVFAAAKWLAGLQQQDGSLPLSASLAGPGWPTPHAMLVWQDMVDGEFEQQIQAGARWLLARKGSTAPRPTSDAIMGHDTTLAGWPWVSNTHSWIEPTAMAIFALCGAGQRDNARVTEGLAVILDRAIETGGWNYGNTTVFGATLRPQPAPTGLALAAVAAAAGDAVKSEPKNAAKIDLACRYLEELLPKVRAPQSLAWGLLGLSAWNRRPAAADDWLADSARTAGAKSDPAMQWAFLLLAAGDARTLQLLHVRGTS